MSGSDQPVAWLQLTNLQLSHCGLILGLKVRKSWWQTHTQTHVHTHRHTDTHTRIHTHTHRQTDTHTQTNTHIHTNTRPWNKVQAQSSLTYAHLGAQCKSNAKTLKHTRAFSLCFTLGRQHKQPEKTSALMWSRPGYECISHAGFKPLKRGKKL